MIPAALAPLASHLWQSTVFAAGAGLLTLALRHNQARVRFWLWLAASYKFLLPFAWLVSVGHLFQWRAAPATVPPALSAVTEVVSGPVFLTALPSSKPAPDHLHALLFAIWAVWACGFVIVAAGWLREWLRMRAIVRVASPLALGLPIRVVSTPARLEPGVFGIFRPLLLLPEGIATRLTPAQLQAVLAHELCHVRRRDNLTAAIHMLVEAMFWFYPLLWWLGARMMDERERACDEEVLRAGSHAQAYAESILKVCEFYIESPLTCVSGVTGSDLKKRIQRIMKHHFGVALSVRKKLLLASAGIAALAVPLIGGALTSTRLPAQSSATAGSGPRFDAASVKVNKSGNPGMRDTLGQSGGYVTATNATLQYLVERAYYPYPDTRFLKPWLASQPPSTSLDLSGNIRFLIFGIPRWAESERFDIEARAEGSPTVEQKQLMLRSLLADRFNLALHNESRQLPVFALVVAKSGKIGPQLLPHKDDTNCFDPARAAPPGTEMPPCGGLLIKSRSGSLFPEAYGVTMEWFAANLSGLVGRIVVDRTGLNGTFDLNFGYTREGGQPGPQPSPGASDGSTQPDIFTALQEQLGLKLESQTGSVDVLVIDHAEEPSPN